MARSQDTWRKFGEREPYFGVLTSDRYRSKSMDAEAVDEMFGSGEAHIAAIWEKVQMLTGAPFTPRVCLDFGCGVGRLVVPLASRSEQVVGIDISPGMLDQARINSDTRSARNVTFYENMEQFRSARPDVEPDFVHSFIVFQHIEKGIGVRLLENMLDVLSPGGVAVLHFTYAASTPRTVRVVQNLRRWVPGVRGAINIRRGRPVNFPQMQMNRYDLNKIMERIQRVADPTMIVETTDHGGYLGVVAIFRKRA